MKNLNRQWEQYVGDQEILDELRRTGIDGVDAIIEPHDLTYRKTDDLIGRELERVLYLLNGCNSDEVFESYGLPTSTSIAQGTIQKH